MKRIRIIAALVILLTFSSDVCCCPGLRLPRIDPSGQRIFLPAPESTTLAPAPFWPFDPTRNAAWQSPPQAPICGTPASRSAVLPYSIYAPNTTTLPAVPLNVPLNVMPATQLSGQTSLDRRDGIHGRLTLNPYRHVAPVGQEVIILASICGGDGYLVTREPIEWSLSANSVGSIVEVDQNNKLLWRQLLHRPPFKRDGSYAKGLTSVAAQVIPRGNPGPADDIYLRRGQTWISVTSASEGATNVTCVGPHIAGWEQRRSTATVYWIDGQWDFPPPSLGNNRDGHVICTRIARTTNGAPLSAWRVVYEVSGGAPASFANGSQRVEVASDANGHACVRVIPQGAPIGVTHIGIRVISAGEGDLANIAVGQGGTTITWSPNAPPSTLPPTFPSTPPTPMPISPAIPPTTSPPLSPATPPNLPVAPAARLDFQATGPTTAKATSTIDHSFSVRNLGTVQATNVEVASRLLTGFVSSSPQAAVFGDRLVWSIGSLAPGQARDIRVRYKPDRGGMLRTCATLTWSGSQPVERCATTEVTMNALVVDVRGDRSAQIGQTARYEVTISNLSDRRLTNVTLEDRYDRGLSHASETDPNLPLIWNIGTLEPGQIVTKPLTFTVLAAGQLCHDVSVKADGGSSAKTSICLNAGQDFGGGPIQGGRPAFSVQKLGPPEIVVGQQAEITLLITNTGQVPLTDLRIVDQYDPGLEPADATPVVQRLDARRIYWNRDELRPGDTIRLGVRCLAIQASAEVCGTVTVTTAEGVTESSRFCTRLVDPSFRPLTDGQSAPRRVRTQKAIPPEMGPTVSARPQRADDSLRIKVSPAAQGLDDDKQTIYLTVSNVGEDDEHDVTLTVETPEGSIFASSINPPMVRAVRFSPDKRTAEFTPIATLRVGETAKFRIVIQRKQSNLGVFRAKVTSDRLPGGIVHTE